MAQQEKKAVDPVTGEEVPTIFIGGLPLDICNDDLKAWAEVYGPLKKATVKMDIYTQRSRGFGFVEFETMESYNALVNSPTPEEAHVIRGKKVDVRQYEPSHGLSKMGVKFSDPPTEDELTCFVGALPKACDEGTLEAFAAQHGPVESVIVKMDAATGKCRGFGFIKCAEPSTVENLVKNFDNNTIDNKWVAVRQQSYFEDWSVKQVSAKGKGKGKFGKGGGFKGGWDMWGGGWGAPMYGGFGGGKGKGKGKAWGPY